MSLHLLDKIMAPAISTKHLVEIAQVIEGCPSALKIVGQLLHLNGAQLTYTATN